MMKITKAEWDRFWQAIGDDDWYIEESDAPDTTGMPPGEVFDVTCGLLAWQGSGAARHIPGVISQKQVQMACEDWGTLDLLATLKRWRKSLATTIVTIEIDKAKELELRQAAKTLGGKVL